MFNRVHKIHNSNALYFEPNFDQNNFLQGMVVEYFDSITANWNPVKFTLKEDISHAFGIYTFNSPSGSNIKLTVQNQKDIYVVFPKNTYECLANKALYYTKEEYANSVYKKMFHAAHKQKVANDKTGCFSFFYSCFIKTEVKEDWDIEKILDHAIKNKNRSRDICVSLGWMDIHGNLINKGIAIQNVCKPKAIKNAYFKQF